ncbi:MAG: hypothetical protein Sapg2KO_39940 [Saprospiraceae bacterium]
MVGCNPAEVEEGATAFAVQKMPDKIDFNFHVKPILSDRCFHCHGPDDNSREAGLRLDTKEGAFAALGDAKDHYAIVAGSLEESSLIERMYTDDPEMMMPPPESNLSLSDYDKAILKQWIEEGAEWKEHWSFIPPQKPSVPAVDNKGWASNDIDRFVFNKMDKAGITPSPQADKAHLLRRLCFDLTGLPPTLEQMDAFLENESPDAVENLIDDLLETDAYAEHMTAKWLDLARYADTHGYQDDLERVMWPWRDWVIHAYKKNMPFDQFVTWQLAGDLLPNPTREQLIATAFNRNHKITQEGGVIPEEYRVEYVADRTQTFGIAFLGLTMECSRCHDHKYDPIYQKDYYSLYSFFNNIPEEGLIPNYGVTPEPFITLTDEEIESTLSFINNIDSVENIELMVMQEMEKPRQAYVLNRGGYDNYGDPVGPSTPAAVLAFEEDLPANRLGLAEWLTDEDNPLMARVTVNRLWQQLFGRGIVATPEDFGNQGSLPTHPDLLDYLAVKFIEDGWDVKKMVKFIAMSSTYQQSSVIPKELLEKDPENLLLARSPRKRLEAEMIRDHALSIGGLLVEQVGGPSVKPYQPEGLWAETTGGGGGSTSRYVRDTGSKLYRRSLYTFWKRTLPPPNMMTFDAASRDFCIVKRQNTSTPMQALILMNDPQIIEAGRALADRAIQAAPANLEDRMTYMFRLSTSRYPTPEETSELKAYFGEELKRFSASEEDAKAFLGIGEYKVEADLEIDEMAAYAILANAIFNLDESITKS